MRSVSLKEIADREKKKVLPNKNHIKIEKAIAQEA